MVCCYNNKCNWCNKRKKDVIKIKIYCKWYHYNICDSCYDNKKSNNLKLKPISRPYYLHFINSFI